MTDERRLSKKQNLDHWVTRCRQPSFRLRRRFHPGQHFVQIRTRKIPAVRNHSGDLLRVANIVQWIRIQQNQIGQLALLNRAQAVFHAQKLCRIERCSLQRLQGSEARSHESLQFFVQAETWQ